MPSLQSQHLGKGLSPNFPFKYQASQLTFSHPEINKSHKFSDDFVGDRCYLIHLLN